MATFYIYLDRAGEWRWTLRAGNGRVIADGSEGYTRKADCLAMVQFIRSQASTFAVKDA